ncbi:MAG TPA: nucleotidyl transferase AbiEii/AbiGii toxin family protein [Oleiagrimonas sp.]|nr:nucleotidyl transferase AbiEii/AbiGii toxin family protein [Oleiagrimonas sp.]
MRVASLDDLMATKLKVVLQRAEAKDYLDIAAMLKVDVDLSRGLAIARAIYGPNFQPSESLKALTFFDDGDLDELPYETRDQLVAAASTVRDLPEVTLQGSREASSA